MEEVLYRYVIYEGDELVGGFIQNLDLYIEREEEKELLESFNSYLSFASFPNGFNEDVAFFFTEKGLASFKYDIQEINDVLVEQTEGYVEVREVTVLKSKVKDLIVYEDQQQIALLSGEELDNLVEVKQKLDSLI